MFFPGEMRAAVAEAAGKSEWAAGLVKTARENARWWIERSDEELWGFMFGPTIERSWMVWSDGFCPACKQDVRMYDWVMDAVHHPWKTACPHCKELFPKNDFQAFYLSGLDSHHIFDHALADRSLLYNTEHPDNDDPLHCFGVDDGNGFSDGEHLWRFIGAYLIYGHWRQLVVEGISKLAAAYVLTSDTIYAHKAAILLDRVADLYPTFHYGEQGYVYETKAATGYVSVWHDACEECKILGLAYDAVSDGIEGDASLVDFLQAQSVKYGLQNSKSSTDQIRSNIRSGLITDVLTDPDNSNALFNPKINSNFPTPLTTAAILTAVDGGPDNREKVMGMIDAIIDEACKYDGLTGERGTANYSAIAPRQVSVLLGYFARMDSGFLKETLKRRPRLYDMFRFHIDTWCLDGSYYPMVGDTLYFASKFTKYAGMDFNKNHGLGEGVFTPFLGPSMVSFLWELYKVTGDKDFLKVIDRWCEGNMEALPYDLFATQPEQLRLDVADAVSESAAIDPPSVLKREWGLGILRSGAKDNAQALWLCTSTGGRHCHANGMNLGLFGYGLDLLPDFGYPPVQFGGWTSERAAWYRRTAAHNTVVVDCKDDVGYQGTEYVANVDAWSDTDGIRYMRASGPGMADVERYERTCALVDISEESFYVIDIFRVKGGSDHTRLLHSHFGTVTTQGLNPQPAEPFIGGSCMQDFRHDPNPNAGWTVDWKIEDKLGYLPAGTDLHLRLTDLTTDTEAWLCEGWVVYGGYWPSQEAWIPFTMSRRRSDTPDMESTFVSIIEPYKDSPSIASARRLGVEDLNGVPVSDSTVGLEIKLVDGRTDILVFKDPLVEGDVRVVEYRDVVCERDVVFVRM